MRLLFQKRNNKSATSFFLTLAVSFLFCGCSALHNTDEEYVPPQSATPAPTIYTAASPTPFSLNPVYDFFGSYSTAASSSRLPDLLQSVDSLDTLELSLELSRHISELNRLKVTICRLIPGDSNYSATLFGAAAGSGEMYRLISENRYEFEFRYENGAVINGSYTCDESVSFTYSEPDSPDKPDAAFSHTSICTLMHTADRWKSTVEIDGVTTVLEIAPDISSFSDHSRIATLKYGEADLNVSQYHAENYQ